MDQTEIEPARSILATGESVDEAVRRALNRLDAEEDSVKIEVLDEPSRGFLGIIGGTRAKVKVTLERTKADLAEEVLTQWLGAFPIPVYIEDVESDEQRILVNIGGVDLGLLIGYHGKNLNALQYLLNIAVGRLSNERKRIVVNVGDYRQRRQKTLERLARRKAKQAMSRKKPVALDPMTAYERKQIHLALQDHPGVRTQSEGDEPERKVVIFPNDEGERMQAGG